MSASLHTEKTIFLEAVEIASPAERAAFLARSCGDDQPLRAAVEALLQSHQRSQGALDATTVGLAECAGTQIGPYKLLQQIGEGGMGTVFMAEQTQPVQRKVALKVIKPGMDSRQIIARFEAERQALAMMDHVNIARVLDAGATESGRPYFVMELVHGVPITRYCDDNHLTPRERLELFVPVCQAIQHAHQKGIIHRDIKPSNVMITLYDGKPVPKVIDFGVAKATEQRLTERTLFTQYGTMVGTPEYMSPEQAEMSALGIDTRSDIYSLGVLLYELLTGSTPLSHKRVQEAAYGEILRLIKEEEPPKPSTRLSESGEALASISAQRHMEPAKLSKLMRGELDWIVMKTLEKDRKRRYETANGLAMDVGRYLNDEQVQACPPSAMYRFHKFARRNRTALAMAAVVAVALLFGIAGTTWQAIRAMSQRDRAFAAEGLAQSRLEAESHARAAEEEQRAQAEANFQKARQAVDEMYTQVAEKWLASQPKLEPLQREFLQKALRFYEEFAQKASADPAIRLETAQAFRRVADIQIKLGEVAPAEHAFRQGIDRLQALADEFPDAPEYRQHLAVTLNNFTVLLGNTGRYPDAEKALRRALDLQENLVSDFPTVPEYRRDLGRSHNLEGRGRAALRQRPEAEKAFRAALVIQNRLISELPSVAEYRKDLADSHIALSSTLGFLGRPQEERQALNEGVGILEKLVTEFPANPEYRNELATAYYCLAGLLPVQEAESAILRALDLQEKLAADFPAVTDFQYDLLRSLERQAGLMADANRIEDAEKAFRRAAVIGDKLVAYAPAVEYYRSRRGTVYLGLAALFRKADRLPEAEVVAREALAILSKLVADFPDVPANWVSLHKATAELGDSLREMGRLPEAEKVICQGLDILENVATHYSTTAYYRSSLAHAFWDLGLKLGSVNQHSDAERAHRRSLGFYDKLAVESPHTPDYLIMRAHNHGQLGGLLQKAGKLEEAEQEYRRAIELFAMTAVDFADRFVDHQWGYNGSCNGLVSLLKATGRTKEAETVYRHAIAIWEKLAADFPTNPEYRLQLAHRHHDLANLARASGRPSEAEQGYRRELVLKEQLVADVPANLDFRMLLTQTCLSLGDLLRDSGRPQEAEQVYDQVLQIREKLRLDFPDKPEYRQDLAETYQVRGNRLMVSGQSEDAELAYRQVFALKAKLAADFPDRLEYRSLNLGDVLWAASRRQGREQTIRLFIDLCEGLVAEVPNAPDFQKELARCHNHLGLALAAAGRPEEAEQAHRRAEQVQRQALELCEKLTPEKDQHHRQELAWTYMNLAKGLKNGKRLEEAEAANRQSLALCEKLYADFPADETYQNWIAGNSQSLALLLAASGRPDEAETFFRRLLELNPQSAGAYNNLAWILANSPDPKFRGAGRAVELAKKAVELAPKEGGFWNTLGVAHYRSGDWRAAVAALEKSRDLRNGGDSFDWFFLAMAHWQLAEKDAAHKWYDQAVAWMEQNKQQDEELQRFRIEAAELVGVK